MASPSVLFGMYKVGYMPPSSSEGAASLAPPASSTESLSASSATVVVASDSSSAAAGSAVAAAAAAAALGPATDALVVDRVVRSALASGYRGFDLAEFYNNEREVGAALASAVAAGVVRRDELYLASKVWTSTIYAGPDAVREQVLKCLADLKVEYLDLFLLHWPVPGKHVAAYACLEDLQREGKVRAIGVSNYTMEDFKELLGACKVRPAVNQIEVNPLCFRRETVDYFQREGVVLQSYRALCNGTAMKAPALVAMAAKYKRTVAQVLGRFVVQCGIVVVAKSVSEERMRENIALFDFALDDADLEALKSMTSEETVAKRMELYRKCRVRDTPLDTTTFL